METSLAKIQNTAQKGEFAKANELLAGFLSELFGLEIASVEIRKDTLSLNSVNGFINLRDGKKLFFKFHHEENEEGLTEYYNSKLLAETSFPVEEPLYVSHEVGKQVLIYDLKTAERMADICKRLDFEGDIAPVVKAQKELDDLSLEKYLETLHQAKPKELAEEPIMQLFYNRLVGGGRYKEFYEGKLCALPGVEINFEELKKLKWEINGISYDQTLEKAFGKALEILSPEAHGNYPAVVAHGDAHNGNVWYNENSHLTMFDPAFAGRHIPALLAEIKATFHNIFAHPLWLYDAGEAKYKATCEIDGEIIKVKHDWQLSPLRQEFLKTKQERLWKPLLAKLRQQGLLPANWQEYMRIALFCCPTLVMNLRSGAGNSRNSHTPATSLLGFSIAIMLSSAPRNGKDWASEFFAGLE